MENPALERILMLHDQCLAEWDHATRTGDVSGIARFAGEAFNGTSAYAGTDRAQPFDRAEGIAGLGQLLSTLKGTAHRAENRVVRLRNDEEAVVFYERIFERDSRVVLRFMVLQTWRLTGAKWCVVREAAELLSA